MLSDNVRQVYDTVSADYARQFAAELDKKPFDRKMLAWLIERSPDRSTLCDMGCGPGQVAAYLKQQGASACGIDLSPGMIAQASHLHADIPFRTGDMRELAGIPDNTFGGIAAFYAIVNLPPETLLQVFETFRRVLCSGGTLLLTFHVGTEIRHIDEWWGKSVSLDFFFFETRVVIDLLKTAGFIVEEVIERYPYPDVEFPSRRAYLFGRRP